MWIVVDYQTLVTYLTVSDLATEPLVAVIFTEEICCLLMASDSALAALRADSLAILMTSWDLASDWCLMIVASEIAFSALILVSVAIVLAVSAAFSFLVCFSVIFYCSFTVVVLLAEHSHASSFIIFGLMARTGLTRIDGWGGAGAATFMAGWAGAAAGAAAAAYAGAAATAYAGAAATAYAGAAAAAYAGAAAAYAGAS